MPNSISKNYTYNLAYQLLLIITPIITTPYVSRILGANNIGIYEYTSSIANYFIIFACLGLSLYGQREIAYTRDREQERDKLFWELVALRCVLALLGVLIYASSLMRFSQYSTYFAVLLINLLASILDVSWFYQGVENFKTTAVRNFTVKTAGIALIFIFVKSESDLTAYFLCYSVPVLVGNISLWPQMKKYIGRTKVTFKGICGHLKPVLLLFLPQLAVSIYTLLDKSMLGLITQDTAQVGYYGQADKVIKLALTALTSMGLVVMPRVAGYFSKGHMNEIKRVVHKSINFVFLLGFPMVMGIVGTADYFVPWFFGEGYGAVIPLLRALSPIVLFIGVSNVLGVQFLLPTMRTKEYTISVLTGAAVNILLNIVLIANFAAMGAAIATVAAELCVTVVQVSFVRKDIDLKSFLKMPGKYIAASCTMLIVILLTGSALKAAPYAAMVQVTAGLVVYPAVLILMRDSFFVDRVHLSVKKLLRRSTKSRE